MVFPFHGNEIYSFYKSVKQYIGDIHRDGNRAQDKKIVLYYLVMYGPNCKWTNIKYLTLISLVCPLDGDNLIPFCILEMLTMK